MLEVGSIDDATSGSENVEGTTTSESVTPVDVGLSIGSGENTTDLSSAIVPFKRENDFDKKLGLDENVEVVTVPLDVSSNLGSTLPDTSSSSTGANKVPTFSTSDYANNFPTIKESMFNVSTV